MNPSQMMKSAHESDRGSYPASIRIDARDRFIGDKLARLLQKETAVDGGIDLMLLDGQPRKVGDNVENILETGGEATHLIEPGYSIHIVDGRAAHDWSIAARASEDCVRLRYVASGDAEYRTNAVSVIDEASSCTFMVQPAGAGLTGQYRRGITYRYCSIDLSRTFLLDRLGIATDQLPSRISNSWQRQEIVFGRIALDRGPLTLMRQLFRLQSDDPWARIEAQAIGLQVLGPLLAKLRDQRHGAAVLVRLKPSERAALTQLRAEIERRFPEPLSIEQAQRISGLNRNKIHYGFKEMFGTSIQRYGVDLRMRRAAEMVRTSSLAIGEIAAELGFSEATNFTAAFRRHFGQLPSAFRAAAVSRPDR